MAKRTARGRFLWLAVAGSLAVAGCAHHAKPTKRELRERRADLVLVARALVFLERPLAQAVHASHRLWPLIDHGLVHRGHGRAVLLPPQGGTAAAAVAALQAARALPAELLPEAQRLTGPAASLAGIYALFSGLLTHSLEVVVSTTHLPSGTGPGARRYLIANVNLYIEAVYDAFFDLSYVGRTLRGAYKRLGAGRFFGKRLTTRELDRLAAFYGRGLRLHPHTWEALSAATG